MCGSLRGSNMNYQAFIDWAQKVIQGASQLGEWLTTPITIGNITIAPLILVSVSGLIIFIGLAIVKWVIS